MRPIVVHAGTHSQGVCRMCTRNRLTKNSSRQVSNLTRDNAKLCAPLPAIAVAISVGHDAAMTSDSPIVNRTIDGRGEPLVAVKHGGYKSSSAGYLIPTRAKSQELRMQLEKELRQGLSSPMDALLFHPRLFADQHRCLPYKATPLCSGSK